MTRVLKSFLLLLFISRVGSLEAQNVWFAPNKADFLGGAARNAKWNDDARGLSVFKYYCDAVLRADPDVIKAHITSLRQVGAKIGLECALLSASGYNGEGFALPNKALMAINKITSLGGRVSYLVMDEPLYYAHYKSTGKRYIGWSIEDVCKNLALSLNSIRQHYPNMAIGDIEPVQRVTLEDLQAFFRCYQRVMGEKLDFFHSDVMWHESDAIPTLRAVEGMVVSNGVRYGVIFNSSDYNAENDAWIDSSKINFDRYFSSGGSASDVIFQSWNKEPTNIAGDKAGKYHSYLIKYACEKLRCNK